ncbi:MAG: DHHW family protein [Faecalibacterium sp.]|nr:DHHW family protein [Ruminococcus sp.]MCM1392191.1 DHHW family protein [Ruminococcus sp.]MCM1485399.1 DHHW family protein [Faecalibacterium sp.]
MNNENDNENKYHDNENEHRKTGIICISVGLIFCLIIVAIPIVTFLLPDKQMSESENRMLAQKPEINPAALADGSFMNKFEKYLSDQFPFRDYVISAKTTIDRAIGKKEENGVYIGSDIRLFEKQTAYDDKHVKSITDSINKFTKDYPQLKKGFILSPNSSCTLSQYLPGGVTEPDQKEQLKKIQSQLKDSNFSWIDCASLFEKAENREELFYRTDHHWTTRAAYTAFTSLMKAWKINTDKTKFNFYSVSDSFQGTLASSSGVRNITDEIEICVPDGSKDSYVVSYESSGRKTATMFESEKLNQKNQYEVFLGGNYDKVIISTNAVTTNTLLIIKDSYANCMLPMFTPFFAKIVVIDPRYLSDNLSGIMKEYQFTHMVFIYNMNTFIGDTSISDVLAS